MDEIAGLQELRTKLNAMKAAVDAPKPALLRAGVVVLKAAADRIDAGGPGWPPNKTHTPLLHRTGTLLRSLTANGPNNVMDASDSSIEVGTNVNYARFLQNGTAFYQRGSPLAKKHGPRRRAHGGMPARKFLFIDDQVAEVVTQIFARYVMGGGA